MAAKEEDPVFSPPLYEQRYQAAIDLARSLEARKVVDMGCGECKLVRLLKREAVVEEVVGVDVSLLQLLLQKPVVQPLITDHLHPRPRPLHIRLMQGSISEPDARLVDFDLLTCIEVIEHLDPPILEQVPSTIFGCLRPKVAFFSTPNSEYNVLFTNFSGFRHPDHRFEWKRSEFQSWCTGSAQLHGYSVAFSGLGNPPFGREALGHCTQTAIFTRLELPRPSSHSLAETPSSHHPQTAQQSPTTSTASVAIIGEPYTVVAEASHPYDQHPLSAAEKLCHEAEYHLNLLLRSRLQDGDDDEDDYVDGDDNDGKCGVMEDEERVRIPLEALLIFAKIKALCSSVDELREALQLSTVVQLEGDHAVLEIGTGSSCASNDDNNDGDDDDEKKEEEEGEEEHGTLNEEPEESWD